MQSAPPPCWLAGPVIFDRCGRSPALPEGCALPWLAIVRRELLCALPFAFPAPVQRSGWRGVAIPDGNSREFPPACGASSAGTGDEPANHACSAAIALVSLPTAAQGRQACERLPHPLRRSPPPPAPACQGSQHPTQPGPQNAVGRSSAGPAPAGGAAPPRRCRPPRRCADAGPLLLPGAPQGQGRPRQGAGEGTRGEVSWMSPAAPCCCWAGLQARQRSGTVAHPGAASLPHQLPNPLQVLLPVG